MSTMTCTYESVSFLRGIVVHMQVFVCIVLIRFVCANSRRAPRLLVLIHTCTQLKSQSIL